MFPRDSNLSPPIHGLGVLPLWPPQLSMHQLLKQQYILRANWTWKNSTFLRPVPDWLSNFNPRTYRGSALMRLLLVCSFFIADFCWDRSSHDWLILGTRPDCFHSHHTLSDDFAVSWALLDCCRMSNIQRVWSHVKPGSAPRSFFILKLSNLADRFKTFSYSLLVIDRRLS